MATITYATGKYKLNNGLIEVDINDQNAASKPLGVNEIRIIKADLTQQKVSGSCYDQFQIRIEPGGNVENFDPHTTHASLLTWSVAYGTRSGGTEAYVEATLTNQYYLATHGVYITAMTLKWILKDNEKFLRQEYSLTFSRMMFVELTNYLYVGFASSATLPMQWTTKRKTEIDWCETDTWIESAGIVTALETTQIKEGSGSLKITAGANTLDQEVYRSFTATDFTGTKTISLWLRPGDTTNLEDTIQFFIEDTVGGKQYSRLYNLKQYYELNAAKTAHDLKSQWRRVVWDISSLTRAAITKFGVRSKTNTAWGLYLDDVWRWGEPDTDVTNAPAISLKICAQALSEAISRDIAYYPFTMVSDVLSDGKAYATAVIGNWYQTQRLYMDGDVDQRATIGPTQEGIDQTEDGKTLTWKIYYAGTGEETNQAGAYNTIKGIHSLLNDPAITPTTNLKPIYDEVGCIQVKPTSYYDFREFMTDLLITVDSGIVGLSDGVNTYIFPTFTAQSVKYRDHDKWWEWYNTMLDNKDDLVRMAIRKWKLSNSVKTRRIWAEVTGLVIESLDGIEKYANNNVAIYRTGEKWYKRYWAYTSAAGGEIMVDRKDGDFQASYYDPIVQEGVTYNLDYTYPGMHGAFWSCYTPASQWGDTTPTIFDDMKAKLEYICKYFDLDGIVISEATVHYRNTFHSRDLILYNTWRTSQGKSTLSDFDRVDNNYPVSSSNPYVCDDVDLWNWRTYQVKAAIQQLQTICHTWEKKIVVDCNADNCSDVIDKNAAPWIGKEFVGDTPKYLGYYGARHGTGMDEIIKACDLIFTWNYFGYADPAYGIQAVYDFCDYMSKYKGRVFVGIGTYPSSNPPSGDNCALALEYARKQGYKVIIVGPRTMKSSYWPKIREVFAKLPVYTTEIVNGRLVVSWR